jgi:hypothetical protein
MITLIFANFFIFIVISAICALRGLDLKKLSNWFYGLYGFISGFLIGFVRSDGAGGYQLATNLLASFQAGIAFAFAILFVGATNRWNRRWAEKYLGRNERRVEEQYDELAESLFNDRKSHKTK